MFLEAIPLSTSRRTRLLPAPSNGWPWYPGECVAGGNVERFRRVSFSGGSDGPVVPGLAEQFADVRDDLAPVQLDVAHELIVRQARHAVLQVEPGGPQGAEVRGDLLRDGFR
jgi:hypothetical protein